MQKRKNKIPKYVASWTDTYFHQSAFDIPLKFPNNKIIAFLSKFKKEEKIILFRGVNKFNQDNFTGVESWTHDIEIAKKYAEEQGSKVVKKLFNPKNILLDTTLFSEEEKVMVGYDYKIDDKEVLIIK
ncbi:hypothetical protein ACFL23_03910 [Patescibacteria group bacterium]